METGEDVVKKTSVIAAVDLNDGAPGIVRRAAKIAQLCDAELVVLHVVEHHTGFESDHVPFMTPGSLREQMGRHAQRRLLALLSDLELTAEVVVRPGRLREVIAQLAATRRARYVVTGLLKWGAIAELAGLGKDRRLTDIGCDVLSVGSDGTQFHRGLLEWLGRLLPDRV